MTLFSKTQQGSFTSSMYILTLIPFYLFISLTIYRKSIVYFNRLSQFSCLIITLIYFKLLEL